MGIVGSKAFILDSNPGFSLNGNKNDVLGCDMGGVYHGRVGALDGAKRRKTYTRRIGCPFKPNGLYSNGSWQLKVRNPLHTHGPSNLSAHPQARKFMDNQRAEIGRLSSMGVRPQTIEAVLRESTVSACFTRRNIYNVRMAERLRQLGGRSPMNILFNDFKMRKVGYMPGNLMMWNTSGS